MNRLSAYGSDWLYIHQVFQHRTFALYTPYLSIVLLATRLLTLTVS